MIKSPAGDSPSSLAKPLVIAHRGASGLAPENTLAAFELGIALGADGVELDVHLSADGCPVVIHDARVDRTTDGTGAVSRFTVDQLQSLDAGGWFERHLIRRPRLRAIATRVSAETGDPDRAFRREVVPTLESVLSLLKASRLERIYIELKGNSASRQALLEAVVALVRSLQIETSVTLLSFNHSIVRQAKEIAGEIRTAATFPTKGFGLTSTSSILRGAAAADVDEVALHFALVSRRIVGVLHERGLSVSVWTVNNKMTMRRLTACGVDAIMTNFPNRLSDVLEEPSPRLSALGRRRQRRGKK